MTGLGWKQNELAAHWRHAAHDSVPHVRRAKLPHFVLSFCEIVTYRTRGLASDSMQITFEKIPQEPAHSFEHGSANGVTH